MRDEAWFCGTCKKHMIILLLNNNQSDVREKESPFTPLDSPKKVSIFYIQTEIDTNMYTSHHTYSLVK